MPEQVVLIVSRGISASSVLRSRSSAVSVLRRRSAEGARHPPSVDVLLGDGDSITTARFDCSLPTAASSQIVVSGEALSPPSTDFEFIGDRALSGLGGCRPSFASSCSSFSRDRRYGS